MPETPLRQQVRELRELFDYLRHGAVSNAAAFVILEETVRAILDEFPTAERQAIHARVSERVPGPYMAEPIAEAVERMFGPLPAPAARHWAPCPASTAAVEPDGEIEAGAAGDTLRLWQAREALRHAELRLTSQTASLQAFEARASALMGWFVTAVSAIGGAAVVSLTTAAYWRAGAFTAALVPAFAGAFEASRLLWPKRWNDPGYSPDVVMDKCDSELQQLEFLIAGYATGIDENSTLLDRFGRLMRRAWWLLFAVPVTAGLLLGLTAALGA